jgi:hypothetical protein
MDGLDQRALDMDEVRPIDPLVSRYPMPLSAERARYEALQARRKGLKLPKGHPYRWLPTFVPYGAARLLSRSAASSRPGPTPPHQPSIERP